MAAAGGASHARCHVSRQADGQRPVLVRLLAETPMLKHTLMPLHSLEGPTLERCTQTPCTRGAH
jgi:hypothetical protein